MGHQVQKFKQNEESQNCVHELLAFSPFRRLVVRMKEEVHVDEAENEPVVRTVLEDVEGGHRVIGESVDKHGLELSLEVVAKDHSQTYLLIQSQFLLLPIDLFLEQSQYS